MRPDARAAARTALAWTPDGRAWSSSARRIRRAAPTRRQLYRAARPARGATHRGHRRRAGARRVSPDGQVGRVLGQRRDQKGPLAGGPTTTSRGGLAQAAARWLGADGRVCSTRRQAGSGSSATAGGPGAVTTLEERRGSARPPCDAADSRAMLYTVRETTRSWGDEEVVAQSTGHGQAQGAPAECDRRPVPADRPPGLPAPGSLLRRALRSLTCGGAGGAGGLHDGVAQALVGDRLPETHRRRPVRRLSHRDAGLHSGRVPVIQTRHWSASIVPGMSRQFPTAPVLRDCPQVPRRRFLSRTVGRRRNTSVATQHVATWLVRETPVWMSETRLRGPQTADGCLRHDAGTASAGRVASRPTALLRRRSLRGSLKPGLVGARWPASLPDRPRRRQDLGSVRRRAGTPPAPVDRGI